MKLTYTIPLPPITKKNSQQIVHYGDRTLIVPSKYYRDYEKAAGYYLRPKPKAPIDARCNVQCVYYMPNARGRDLVNLLEATLDVLVEYGILKDDNYNIAATHDGSRVEIDRQNPRTEITITEVPK